MKLQQVFTDFELIVKGKGQHGRYPQQFKVTPLPKPKPITLSDLEAYVQNLAQRYPQRGFKLKKTRRPDETLKRRLQTSLQRHLNILFKTPVDHAMIQHLTQQLKNLPKKIFYVITQKASPKVPIYIDLETQTFWVPKTYLTRKRKLVNYICMRTLGALGISQSKYYRGG